MMNIIRRSYMYNVSVISVLSYKCQGKAYSTGWAKKVIPLVHILHCTRGITFLAHPVLYQPADLLGLQTRNRTENSQIFIRAKGT